MLKVCHKQTHISTLFSCVNPLKVDPYTTIKQTSNFERVGSFNTASVNQSIIIVRLGHAGDYSFWFINSLMPRKMALHMEIKNTTWLALIQFFIHLLDLGGTGSPDSPISSILLRSNIYIAEKRKKKETYQHAGFRWIQSAERCCQLTDDELHVLIIADKAITIT